MATIFDDLPGFDLFVETDVYFHTVDNRPLWNIGKCLHAINDELASVQLNAEEVASFVIQTPATGGFGGKYKVNLAGTIARVIVSQVTGGSSGNHVFDLNINGTTAYTTQGNRPTLAFDDADGVVVATAPDIVAVAAGDILSADLDTIQAGSPVWARIDIFLTRTYAVRDVADYDVGGSPLTITYNP